MYILVVERNRDVVAGIYDFFEARGQVVDVAYDGKGGQEFSDCNTYDAIILNLKLPDINGADLCRLFRQAGQVMPILIYAKSKLLQDKLDSFSSGADDYLPMPFEFQELEARIQALVRRSTQVYVRKPVYVADLMFNPETLQTCRAGCAITLPPIPLRILAYLIQQSPAVVSRRQIERHIWGNDRPDTDSLRAHLHTLRNAVDKPFRKKLLHTIRGMGYQLAEIT